MEAFATTAADGSTTVPDIDPELDWAFTIPGTASKHSKTIDIPKNELRIRMIPPRAM
jgi:hypothetical protein